MFVPFIMTGKTLDAVFLSIFDWWYHSHGHSDFQVSKVFARQSRVLFVNSVGMRAPRPGVATSSWQRIARKLKSMSRPRQRPVDDLDLTVMTAAFAPFYAGVLARANEWGVAQQIRHAMRQQGMGGQGRGRPVVVVTAPTFARIAFALDPAGVIYYRSDRHSAFTGADSAIIRGYEELLFERADAVLYTNYALFEEEAPRLKGKAVYLGHGVDLDHFSPDGPLAEEVAALPGPRVGFFGDLRERTIDFDLVAKVAALLPEVQFVLGGTQLDDLSQLAGMANVHLLPACDHEDMPPRWRALDAVMLPYKRTAWAMACEPIKLNEVLATGLPAIGTRLPAFERRAGLVTIADDAEQFAAAIAASLALGRPDAAAVAAIRAGLPSWAAMAETISALVKV